MLTFLKVYDCLKGIGICNKTLINIPVYFEIKKINNACFIDLSINLQLILPPIVQYMCLSSQNEAATWRKGNNYVYEL